MKTRSLQWMSWAAAPIAFACASAPPPTERMASAEASVRAAREVGAERVPQAELHVRLAEEQIQRARKFSKDGDNERADLLLQRAGADAELALALAREEFTRAEAQRVLEQTRDLQQQNREQNRQKTE